MSTCFVGKAAPSFSMNSTKNLDTLKDPVQLSDYKNRWLILFFYPLDFTFVCPTEITALSDRYDEFQDLGCDILGVSCDSVYSHRAWIKQDRKNGGLGNIKYPLAADLLHNVSIDYGVFDESAGHPRRGLFIIDDKGIIRYQVVTENSVGRSTDETLRVLKALQSGGLCPVDWKPGQVNLKN